MEQQNNHTLTLGSLFDGSGGAAGWDTFGDNTAVGIRD